MYRQRNDDKYLQSRIELNRSSSVKMMLARTGVKQDPIETPSICSNKTLSKEKAVLVQESIRM